MEKHEDATFTQFIPQPADIRKKGPKEISVMLIEGMFISIGRLCKKFPQFDIRRTYDMLKDDAVWLCPAANAVLRKKHGGFVVEKMA